MPRLYVSEPVTKTYQTAVAYRSYHLINKSQKYNDNVASEMQQMWKKGDPQMKNRAFNKKDSISVTTFSTELEHLCESSLIQEFAVVRPFPIIHEWSHPLGIKERLNLSSNDLNERECTITTYDEMLDHLLWCYNTKAIIVKANEETFNFEHGSITRGNPPKS